MYHNSKSFASHTFQNYLRKYFDNLIISNQSLLVPLDQSFNKPKVSVFENRNYFLFSILKAVKLFHNLQTISEFWSDPTIVQTPLQLST